MKHELLNDEPLTDKELFAMLRDSFDTDEACWYVVREAQQSYKQLRREFIMQEIEQERHDRDQFGEEAYAA